jgi:hypothetical protein
LMFIFYTLTFPSTRNNSQAAHICVLWTLTFLPVKLSTICLFYLRKRKKFPSLKRILPVPAALRSKMHMVLDRSKTGIVGSKPLWVTERMSVFFCVVMSCVDRGLTHSPHKQSYQQKSVKWIHSFWN